MWWVRGPRKELLLLVLKHVCLTSTSNTQRRTRLYRNEPGSGSQIPFMATRRQDNTFHLKLCQRANGPLISRMMKEIICSRSLQITSKTSSGRLCNKAWSHIWRTEFVSFFFNLNFCLIVGLQSAYWVLTCPKAPWALLSVTCSGRPLHLELDFSYFLYKAQFWGTRFSMTVQIKAERKGR